MVLPAALMLGSDKSRGYCLGMICADFLAGATSSIPCIVMQSAARHPVEAQFLCARGAYAVTPKIPVNQ